MRLVDRTRRELGVWVRWRLRWRLRRSQRIAPVWPTVVFCCACLLLSVYFLVTLAYIVGKGSSPSSAPWKWVSSALGAPITTTIAKPAVALGLGAVLVLMIGACFRRIWLERLVRLPGPILVRDLTVPSNVSADDVPGLNTRFRQRLQELRLQAPTPVPGAIPAENFLEMLDSDHLDAKNPLASAVRILQAAIPKHAYEVSPTLLVDTTSCCDRRYGVAAQVTRLPHEAIPVDTAWAASYENAVIEAADIVTAAVLPRTRLSKRPPWSGWRHYEMPSPLVHHFDLSQELNSQRRYEEALDHCFSALKLDPKSVDLRLHQGFVQEKLGLSIDAVATYAAARKIASETSRALYGVFRSLRNRRASGRIATYRLAVLLAGKQFADQWRRCDKATLRGEQRDRMRRRLKPELIRLLDDHQLIGQPMHFVPRRPNVPVRFDPPVWFYFHEVARDDVRGPPPWTESAIEALLDDGQDEDHGAFALRNVLAYLTERMLERVGSKLRRPWVPSSWLSPLAVDLTIDWVNLRHDWLKQKLQRPAEELQGLWPPNPDDLAKRIPVSRLFSTWTERYNAACLYAVPLMVDQLGETPTITRTRRRELSELAVAQLERAMSSAPSAFVASRRDWVLSEDPDLIALRRTDEFKHFEAIYFPLATRTPFRPDEVNRWEQIRYTHDILAESARRWERVWRQRRNERDLTDPATMLDWYGSEEEAWGLVYSLSREWGHWRVRHELIQRMSDWGAAYGFGPLTVSVRRFDDHGLGPGREHERSQERVDKEIKDDEKRLDELHTALQVMNGDLANLKRLQAELRTQTFRQSRIPVRDGQGICDVRAGVWQRLGEWIDETPCTDHSDTYQGFEDAVTLAAEVSQRVRSRLDSKSPPIGVN